MAGTRVFTFGYGQAYAGGFVELPFEVDASEARALMVEAFGRFWSMEYSSQEEAGVDRFNLRQAHVCLDCRRPRTMPWYGDTRAQREFWSVHESDRMCWCRGGIKVELCSSGHDEVCYESRECPACAIADELKDRTKERDDLEEERDALQAEVDSLEAG